MGVRCKLYQLTWEEARLVRPDPQWLGVILPLKDSGQRGLPRSKRRTVVYDERQLMLFGLPSPPPRLDLPDPTIWFVDLYKNWQVVEFFLAGGEIDDAWERRVDAIFGGVPLATYGGGPPEDDDEDEDGVYFEVDWSSKRILEPAVVRDVADALSAVTPESLCERFDPVRFLAAQLYCGPDRLEDAIEYSPMLAYYFNELVAFYQDAVKCGSAVVIDLA